MKSKALKKYKLIALLLLVSIVELFSQCPNEIVGSPGFYTKQASYYCHQYVKAALIGGYVNMATGVPSNESQYSSLYENANIATDKDFIRVCSESDAKAFVPVHYGNNAYHSAIRLSDGQFASTPGSTNLWVYKHNTPRAFTSACLDDVEYYSPIPNIQISGSSAVNQGTQFTLTLTNNGQPFPSYLQLDDTKWRFNETGSYFTFVSKTATSITLIANNLTGSSNVRYNLVTGCNGADFFRAKMVQVLPNCTGTLNGGSLYTFNYVLAGSNQVNMYLNSWTWVKTSGNASWSTSNGGKNMTFTVSSGCATFNAYNASCNLTFTFCKSSSFSTYTVMDMKTLRVIKEGKAENIEEINALLDELPSGGYVVKIDGNTRRYVKSN